MKAKRVLLLAVCLCAASQFSRAAGEVTVLDQPNCSEWLDLTSNGKKKWLLGFLSGMNRGYAINHKGHDPLAKATSYKQVFDWMDNYCKANRQRDIADGGFALFAELKGP